jgi:serpin B
VNEEGTEAAASTAVTVFGDPQSSGNVNPIPIFYANHPFIFFIQDRDTGAILFMGRVMNPVED